MGAERPTRYVDCVAEQTVDKWRTDHGSIDLLSSIPGDTGQPVTYEELSRRATFVPTRDLRIQNASLDDIIVSKAHANGVKDRRALPELRALRDRGRNA